MTFELNKEGRGVNRFSAHAQCYDCATEWSRGSVINLGGLPGSTYSEAYGINDAGQAVGNQLCWRGLLRRRVEPRQRHQTGRPARLHG